MGRYPRDCECVLDHAIGEEEWGARKKRWGYGWPDVVRDEVFARVLELNAARAVREAGVSNANASARSERRPEPCRDFVHAQGGRAMSGSAEGRRIEFPVVVESFGSSVTWAMRTVAVIARGVATAHVEMPANRVRALVRGLRGTGRERPEQ